MVSDTCFMSILIIVQGLFLHHAEAGLTRRCEASLESLMLHVGPDIKMQETDPPIGGCRDLRHPMSNSEICYTHISLQ